MTSEIIIDELRSVGTPEKSEILQRFFKTGKGEYGEGDVFIGVPVPLTRSVAKSNLQTPLPELHKLLKSPYHEARLCALLILVERFKKAKSLEKTRKEIYDFYIKHSDCANNWDLVDLTCPTIVGGYLMDKKDRSILYKFAESTNLWKQRIAIVSTETFIKNDDFTDTIALAQKLLHHPHDLMHKAVGWMLREIGKRDRLILTNFLEEYATQMPRTALRYAIEHYPEQERQYFLKKK